MRNYLNHLYNSTKIYNATKNEDIIATYDFITSKINIEKTRVDCKDELITMNNYIDDFIESRERKHALIFTIIGSIFSAASLVQLVIELLKIFDYIK